MKCNQKKRIVNMHHLLVQGQLTSGLNMLLKEHKEEQMFLMISERHYNYSSSQEVHFSEVFPKHFIRCMSVQVQAFQEFNQKHGQKTPGEIWTE